jgi:hypothetical protein
MGRAGLFSEVAFLLLHHPRKEGAQDELDEVSGAWGGKPDTMLRLEKLNGNRASPVGRRSVATVWQLLEPEGQDA